MADHTKRLEYLRRELRAERISYGEIAELQSLAEHIAPGDIELREAAGIPETAPTNPNERVPYQRAAQLALECQNACNLSGIANTLAREVMPAIWKEADRLNQGTDWVNTNPIVTLFLSKLNSLNRNDESMEKFSQAYEACSKIMLGDQPRQE